MNKLRILIIAVTIVISGATWGTLARAQAEGHRFFPETGHQVSGEFLDAYQSVKSPYLLYGYPITDAFTDPVTETTVQYFQKARFEYSPESAGGVQVRLSSLGEFLYDPQDGEPISSNSSTCRTFSQTGFKVCLSFLDFFDKNGGVAQFGYPISNFEVHDERIVQYFQKARFEWHPEYPVGQRVTLSDLGARYFAISGTNPTYLNPDRNNNAIATVIGLQARAFVSKAVTPVSGSQTVYVVVQDQNGIPLPEAQVVLIVKSPSGEEGRYILPTLTDESGMASYTFPYRSSQVGLTQITVEAAYNGMRSETFASFRVWW